MKTLRLGLLAQFLCLLCMSIQADAADVVIDHSEPLRQLHFEARGGSAESQKLVNTRFVSMQFDAFGKRFDIPLEENHRIADAIVQQQNSDPIEVYRGKISGVNDSWVRLTIANDIPRGMMWDGREMYGIDVVDGETSVFRLADLRVTNGAMMCSRSSPVESGADLLKTVLTEVAAQAPTLEAQGAVSELDLAAIGDFEFASMRGADAEDAIVTRMNNVDGIFSTQLGVQVNVTQIEVFTTPNDPFESGSEAESLLNELSDYRFATPEQNSNGLSHLFTGRNLNGSTVGIAYGGGFGTALCSQRFGAGLTQATHSSAFDSLIVAHELGHNFGAPHDGEEGSVCENESQTFLMAPSLNNNDTFSACSIAEMQQDVNIASCISSLPVADISISTESSGLTALLGDSVTLEFDLNSNGTESVTGVQALISVPANVILDSVVSSAGSCTNGAGDISCSVSAVTAGSTVSISVSIGTPSVGAASFTATVTADNDINNGNNLSTASISVEPAVDLVLMSAGNIQIEPNSSANVVIGVENRASLSASDVVLMVSPNSGIRVDSASWDAGDCSISNSEVTCTTASLAAQASSSLTLGVTGVTAGLQSYTVTVSAGEADRDLSNNDTSGQINVSEATSVPTTTPPPTSNSDGGGGGSFGFVLIWLLSLHFLVRKRREVAIN